MIRYSTLCDVSLFFLPKRKGWSEFYFKIKIKILWELDITLDVVPTTVKDFTSMTDAE